MALYSITTAQRRKPWHQHHQRHDNLCNLPFDRRVGLGHAGNGQLMGL